MWLVFSGVQSIVGAKFLKQRDEARTELRRMKSGQQMSDKMAKVIERLELEERIKQLKDTK